MDALVIRTQRGAQHHHPPRGAYSRGRTPGRGKRGNHAAQSSVSNSGHESSCLSRSRGSRGNAGCLDADTTLHPVISLSTKATGWLSLCPSPPSPHKQHKVAQHRQHAHTTAADIHTDIHTYIHPNTFIPPKLSTDHSTRTGIFSCMQCMYTQIYCFFLLLPVPLSPFLVDVASISPNPFLPSSSLTPWYPCSSCSLPTLCVSHRQCAT